MSKLRNMRLSTKYSQQRGASALEASLALVPVLLVCLLGIEFVHAHQSKQLVSLALQEAGRRASITNAHQHKVNQAFAHALTPLFTPAGQYATPLARLEATIARHERLYALPLWQLELTELSRHGMRPHDHRALQLDLLYLHEPRQAWLRQALRQSARWRSTPANGLAARAQQQGLVAMPLRRRVVLHAGEVQHGSEKVTDGARQPPVQALNERWALARTRLESRSNAGLDVFKEDTHPAKTSLAGGLRQRLEQDKLCGVLLCCAQ